MKTKINELNIKITELANYLKISRPTLYKYIEEYESGNYDLIDKKVLSVFKYIEDNELTQKENIILFILDKVYVKSEELEIGGYKFSFLVKKLSKKSYFNSLLKLIFSKEENDVLFECFVRFMKSKKNEDFKKLVLNMKGFIEND